MDGRMPTSSRVVSPVQFSTMAMSNGLDFGSSSPNNLFPSLVPVGETAVGEASGSNEKAKADLDDKAVQNLLEIAKMILHEQRSPVHIKDIISRAQQKGFHHFSNMPPENLELMLRHEAGKPGADIRQCQQHWFTVKTVQLSVPHRSVIREANNIKYRKKYHRLRKIVKRLIFENAAIADEIVKTEAKFQRCKSERKFLLKRHQEYRAMAARQAVPPIRVVLPPPPTPEPPVVNPPTIPPPAPVEPPPKPKIPKVKVKKVSVAKAKKEAESSSPVVEKPTSEHTKGPEVVDAASALPESKGEPPVKPKRKKPGTAIKRRVQPIPVDLKGKPVFPIVLGGLTVHSLGDIVWDRPGFHSERYIWPVGFCSSRFYPSMKTPDNKCIYTCKILDGGYGPTFVMSPEDDSENSIEASSATACHCVVLKAINKARGKDATNTGSGPEFFGFSHPTIQYLLQSLPNARKCSKYQWVKFELPKGKMTGKLGVLAGDESTEAIEDQEETSTSCHTANNIFIKEEPSESSMETMQSLTLPNEQQSNMSQQLSSPGFEPDVLGCQLKSTSGDPSLDLGTPISPPQNTLSSPLNLSPKINTNSMSPPSATSQPSFHIPPSSPLFSFDETDLPD